MITDQDRGAIERFKSYVADLDSEMGPEAFARKWHEYMEVDEAVADAYYRRRHQ